MKKFYISDMHFGHANIMKHCNRPFKNVEEMDKIMTDNWNKTVSDKDTVYILGDAVWSKADITNYLNKLNGKKIMILGNHDYDISKYRNKYSNIFDNICSYLEIRDTIDDHIHKIVLSHYPMAEWNGFFHDSIHLYGHIHNNVKNHTYDIMKNIKNAYNVGTDILDFTPRTLEDVIKYNKIFFEKNK